jgi:hemerythrin-like domain-containing protein
MIQIGRREEVVADQPLEHLVACHDRILARLGTLQRIGEGLETDPQAALEALRNTIRFFEISGRLHTEDEERSVFPRLRTRLKPEQLAYIDSLEAQHREKELTYAELKDLAGELEKEVTPDRAERFRGLAARLGDLYRSHIASENDVLIAIGRSALTSEELALIRDEMRQRRQI